MSRSLATTLPVIIVGGGPVGLFLGCCLARLGLRFHLLERSLERFEHSRSIGIHPVSLELLEALELSESFMDAGIRVDAGRAIASDGRTLGTLSFASCPPPYPFVLTLPQPRSEVLLEQRLEQLAPGCLRRGAAVEHVVAHDTDIEVRFCDGDGREERVRARYVVACDGRDSTLRAQAKIPFEGAVYPDRFAMGDFDDTTRLGNEAAIFLHREGLVESFPLPEERRRWVVRLGAAGCSATLDDLRRLVQQRCGHDLAHARNAMFSAFGIEHYLARTFVKGNLLLAGDAAHITSPIGGQGMNLGWQDAWELAQSLAAIIDGDDQDPRSRLAIYSHTRRQAARAAIRRAALYTALGRRRRWPQPRDALVRLVLNTALARPAARIFTMRVSASAVG